MHIAYIRDDETNKYRKPTRKEKIEALSDHLISKWTARDREKAPAEVLKLKRKSTE